MRENQKNSSAIKKTRRGIVLFIISVVAIFLLSACSAAAADSTSMTMKKDGSGQIHISFDKTLIADKAEAESAESFIAALVDQVDTMSGGTPQNHKLKLKSIDETADSFVAKIDLRRIYNLSGVGDFRFSDAAYYKGDSGDVAMLAGLQDGTGAAFSAINILNGKQIDPSISEGKIAINGIDAADGAQISCADIIENEKYLGKKDNNIFFFRAFDLEYINEIEITFAADIVAYSSEGITLVDKNTVRITPSTIRAKVKDVNNMTNIERDVSCFMGFVIIQPSPNSLLIGGFVVLGLGIGVLIFFAIKKKWFSKLFRTEKSRAAKKEKVSAQNEAATSVNSQNLASDVSTELTVKSEPPTPSGAAAQIPKISGSNFAQKLRRIKRDKSLYLLLLPGLVLLLIFNYTPMFGLILSFKEYDVGRGIFGSEWIGFDNFRTLFRAGGKMGLLFKNTVGLAALRFLVGWPASVILALLLNEVHNKVFKRTIQTASYLPYFLSWITISGILFNFLNDNGIVNRIFGIDHKWFVETDHWWGILTITSVWKGAGWGTIMFLAGLAGINSELYEASSIDGAGKLAQVFHVTLPGLMPVIGISLIMNMGNLVRDDFEQIIALVPTGGEIYSHTEVFGSYIFNAVSDSPRYYGVATAAGLFQSLLSMILVVGSNYIVKKTDNPAFF